MKTNRYLALFIILCGITFLSQRIIKSEIGKNPHGEIKWNCQDCHTVESWEILKKPLEFYHGQTGFSLLGAHRNVKCINCHNHLEFSHIGVECADCHTDVHRNQFGIDCENCHTPLDWVGRRDFLEQHSQRGFPLLGVHTIADCDACHIRQGREEFIGTPIDCDGCHADNFIEARNPDHAKAGFASDCEACHIPVASSWMQTNYQHPAPFVIKGAHATIECADCHQQIYSGTPDYCIGCHEDDLAGTSDPSHVALGFPTDCEICHSESGWEGAQFDHIAVSGFEILGAHVSITCVDCHIDNQLDLPRDCIGCHRTDFENVIDPDHISGGFPDDCVFCHSDIAWSPATFNHEQTAFPLTGAHNFLACENCHQNGQFSGTPFDCYDCHNGDYNSVQDPDHAANNFEIDCTQCHTTNGWTPVTFSHNQTQFPLTGAHIGLNCILCHADGYDNTPIDCFACHEGDYNSVEDPNHVTNNFSTDCTVCHTTAGWLPVSFNHSQTQFPLTGAHVSLECILCHADGYDNTPTDCFACHEDDYNSVQDPNHVTNNFSTDCTVCHTTDGWSPASFDHSQTQFPLTGAHIGLECLACHFDGYENTPSDCYACHEGNYNNTVDPNHQLMGFPIECEMCHTTSNWGTAWNHDSQYFPIFSGRHQGDWNLCADCHVIPDVYETFECIFCHAHNQQDTDETHLEVPGYLYNSQACYDCHPDGEG